jgi:prevent-host-death family protein
MSLKVTVRQLQEQLPDLLDRAVKNGEECIVQRNGKDYAVLVSAKAWRRHTKDNGRPRPAPMKAKEQQRRVREIGKRLDALGPEYRLSKEKQARIKALLEKNKDGLLTRAERRDLNALLRESEEVMLRRAEAMDKIL